MPDQIATATATGCGPAWISPIDGTQPDAGPHSPGRFGLHQVLGVGYETTDYRPC